MGSGENESETKDLEDIREQWSHNETERYGNGNKTWRNAENGKHKVLEARKRSEDGKINGDGKTEELEVKEVRK